MISHVQMMYQNKGTLHAHWLTSQLVIKLALCFQKQINYHGVLSVRFSLKHRSDCCAPYGHHCSAKMKQDLDVTSAKLKTFHLSNWLIRGDVEHVVGLIPERNKMNSRMLTT